MALLASALLAAALAVPVAADPPIAEVTVDSVRREVVITAGPYDLPNMPGEHHGMMMDHSGGHDTPVMRFAWPHTAYLRGFKVEVFERGTNRPLSRKVLHHMIMVNFDRRQLLYSAAERILGVGTETADVTLPRTIGVPLEQGMQLGMFVSWHNDTGVDLKDVMLRVTMQWLPENQNPRPMAALPIYMDVNLTVGGSNTWDVTPGRAEKAWEFTVPVSGRLLGVGGHLHDYGSFVKLEDVATGRELTRVAAKRDKAGKVSGVTQKLFGVSGEGLRLVAGRRYRVVGVYENPTDQTLIRGAMAHIVGLFAPDDLAKWPRIELADVDFQRDLASLSVMGDDDGHDHGAHDHP